MMNFELDSIYLAPEISKFQSSFNRSHKLSNKNKVFLDIFADSHSKVSLKSENEGKHLSQQECISTDCSSDSDEEQEEDFYLPLKQVIYQSLSINHNHHKCIKPSLFNPKRESILASSTYEDCLDELESLSLNKKCSFSKEPLNESLYRLAIMNCAFLHPLPDEIKQFCFKKEKKEVNEDYLIELEENISEEELLQDLYDAPEML